MCLLGGMMLLSCTNNGYQITDKGVIVEVTNQQENGARKVRLEAVGEKLIRVSATPNKKFADTESLIIVPQAEKTAFQVEDLGEAVALRTSEVTATVNKTTGQVVFADAEGNQILAEEQGGRTFEPFEADGSL